MNKETLLRKNNIMVNQLRKERPLLLDNILRSLDEYAEYYHQDKVKTFGLFSVRDSVCDCKAKEPCTFTEHSKIVEKCVNCGKPIANDC